MNELNIDAESVTRNKTYSSSDHLQHLLKVGWNPGSQLIKKFLIQNNLTNEDLKAALSKLNEVNNKACCNERENHSV